MFAPPLKTELYAQWYELRKNASTMSANQNAWFADYATQLRNNIHPHEKDSFSVPSIGTGEGDNDLLLADRLSRQFSSVHYSAVEPNGMHAAFLRERIRHCALANVSLILYILFGLRRFVARIVRFNTFWTLYPLVGRANLCRSTCQNDAQF